MQNDPEQMPLEDLATALRLEPVEEHLRQLAAALDATARGESWEQEQQVRPAAAGDNAAALEVYRRRARAEGQSKGLPAAVFDFIGAGRKRAFIPWAFLDYPLADFENRGRWVQQELTLDDGKVLQREVYTMRDDQKKSLTGRQENILFTLLNDQFLSLTRGPNARNLICGSVEDLRAVTGRRVRTEDLIEDLRALGHLFINVRNFARKTDDPYSISGPLFTLTMRPESGAWSVGADTIPMPPGRHPFVLVINDLIAFQILRGAYQRIDLQEFWKIKKPRDRRVYAYLTRAASQLPVNWAKFATACGFVVRDNRKSKYNARRAIEASLTAVSKTTGIVTRYPGQKTWFIDRLRLGWVRAAPSLDGGSQRAVNRVARFNPRRIPEDIRAAITAAARNLNTSASVTEKAAADRLVQGHMRALGTRLADAYRRGGFAAWEKVVATERAARGL